MEEHHDKLKQHETLAHKGIDCHATLQNVNTHFISKVFYINDEVRWKLETSQQAWTTSLEIPDSQSYAAH